jgi:hypothetical protein
MKHALSVLAAALLLSSAVANGDEPARNVVGSWQGTLDAGTARLRIVFNIARAADGGLTATMDSPDQGARGIPVDAVTVTGTSLTIEMKHINGAYNGILDASGNAVAGQWTQGPQSLPLNLVRSSGADAAASGEALSGADLAASKEVAEKIAGTWNGALAAGGRSLRLRVNIAKTAAGAATGTMDSLDQGANGIPISAITLKDGTVRFEARGIGGIYEGALAADCSTLTGQWQQGGQSLPLNLQKAKPE